MQIWDKNPNLHKIRAVYNLATSLALNVNVCKDVFKIIISFKIIFHSLVLKKSGVALSLVMGRAGKKKSPSVWKAILDEPCRLRTSDPQIKSLLLYQLS